jgi:hypothetical protein
MWLPPKLGWKWVASSSARKYPTNGENKSIGLWVVVQFDYGLGASIGKDFSLRSK